MVGRGSDIQRLGDLTGNNVEFRQFSAPVSAQSDWSLLNAVSRSAEASKAVEGGPQAIAAVADSRDGDWSMLATLAAPLPLRSVEAPTVPVPGVITQPKAEASPIEAAPRAPRPAAEAQPGFGHLFRKAPESDPSTAATPLAALLKAISRCP
jgi:hypothetical protein